MLSDSAYEQIRNQADLEVVSLGRFRLKNVGRPFDIYAVRSDGLVVPDATALEGKGERIERFGARLPEAAAWGGYPGGVTVEKGAALFPRRQA